MRVMRVARGGDVGLSASPHGIGIGTSPPRVRMRVRRLATGSALAAIVCRCCALALCCSHVIVLLLRGFEWRGAVLGQLRLRRHGLRTQHLAGSTLHERGGSGGGEGHGAEGAWEGRGAANRAMRTRHAGKAAWTAGIRQSFV